MKTKLYDLIFAAWLILVAFGILVNKVDQLEKKVDAMPSTSATAAMPHDPA